VQLDFWNNPLVVTAMRLKYRRGSPGIWAALWVLGLLGLGALMHHLSQTEGFRFPTAYLIALIAVQGIVSSAIAVVSTSSSMNAEVVNRTLDFQKIVTLSPRALLVGKMIGEPAMSYFLILASMPLAALCWGLGAASGPVIFWLYVNLATFVLMSASFGLINSLTPPAQTASRQNTKGGAGAGLIIMFAVIPQMIVHGRDSLDTPGVGDLAKLLTPIGSIIHLWKDSAWNADVAFWGLRLPSLIMAPICQLAVAAWIVAAMSRRLKNTLDPLASKPRSYLTLAVVDLVMAAICFSQWRQGIDATKLVYGYCLAHIVISMVMMFATAPRRAAVISFAWRADGRRAGLRELLLADRADMRAAVAVYALIGLLILFAGLVGPITALASTEQSTITLRGLVEICLATFAVIVGLGGVHQLLIAATSRGGQLLFIVFLVLANALPPGIAGALELAERSPTESTIESLVSLSPAGFFTLNLSRVASGPVSANWLIALYLGIGALSYALLSRVLNREAAGVRRKLTAMGLS
jgi:hypothetical protein